MKNIVVIDKFEQIDNIEELIKLIKKQMKVVSGDYGEQRILNSLKSVLKVESRARLFLIKSEKGSYAGFAFGNICSGLESGGDYFWINELFIDDKFRGKSLASELLKFIECWCKERDIRYIACVTGLTNTSAKKLYEKNKYDLNELIWVDKDI